MLNLCKSITVESRLSTVNFSECTTLKNGLKINSVAIRFINRVSK